MPLKTRRQNQAVDVEICTAWLISDSFLPSIMTSKPITA
jgi:hypothetical protein